MSTVLGILPTVIGLLQTALGTSWPGLIGAGLVIGLGVWGAIAGVEWWNDRRDSMDADNAGADAGQTATDMAKQAAEVRTGLDGLEKLDPPEVQK